MGWDDSTVGGLSDICCFDWFVLLKAVVERKAQDLCSSWGLRAYRHVAPELSIFDKEENIFTSHWPASTSLALGIRGWTDNVITMGAERMIPTLVKGVAVFPAIAPAVPILNRLLTLADKLLWVDQDLPDPLLCPPNLFSAPFWSRRPFCIWDMEIQPEIITMIYIFLRMVNESFVFLILYYQQQGSKRKGG